MPPRNVVLLIIAQLISVTGSVSMVQLGGLVGRDIAPRSDLATLPLSMMVVGTALGTLLAGRTMQLLGRRKGFVCGAAIGLVAMLGCAFATGAEAFAVYCLAGILFGIGLGFAQQYRFAAAESVAADKAPIAISLVLLGSIGGAVLAPQLIVMNSQAEISATAAGVFFMLAVLLGASMLILATLYRDPLAGPADAAENASPRVRELLHRPGFGLAVAGGAVSYGVMTLMMTATPISMHAHHGYSLGQTGWVISSHVVAMYLPSFFTGVMIARVGARAIMLVGVVALLASVGCGLAGQLVSHYWWSLVFLGVGWNFLFVGGTTMLTETYQPEERFKAQSLNDFCVFGAAALASLASGAMLHYIGWTRLLLVPIPLLLLVAVGLVRSASTKTTPLRAG